MTAKINKKLIHQELERRQREYEAELAEQRRLIALSGIDEIDFMSGREFEQKMAIHFETIGWNAQMTPGSGDFGADLILITPDNRRIVAQLKRYAGSVGISAVQEVIGAIPYYKG